jgi:cytochrome c553
VRFNRFLTTVLAALGVVTSIGAPAWAQATTPAAQLQRWQAAAGAPGDAARGQKLFNTKAGNDVSCASCHGSPPTGPSRHASTGKPIDALAPAFNSERFADQAKADKWFRRNCKDVFSRECSAAEKADLMAYLLSLRQ